MALYDNKHWLLSHIRNSFVSSDDTGMCEIVMAGENIYKNIEDTCIYPGLEEADEEDDLAHSLDNYSDLEFGLRRQRSNTAMRLEKMDKERREAANITRIKWEAVRPFSSLTDEEKNEMFGGKDLTTKPQNRNRKISVLTMQIQQFPNLPQNPFQEFSKFDGCAQVGVPVRRYGIFLTILKPEHRNFPMFVTVIATARVYDLIGLILWKCSLEFSAYTLKDTVDYYGLHIAEDDGEVDWVFPCLDPQEIISKFVFRMLALVERKPNEMNPQQTNNMKKDLCNVFNEFSFNESHDKDEVDQADEEITRLQDQVTAIEASLYTSYKVLMLTKVRTKIGVHLGISGEKVDIDPLLKQNVGSKFLSKRKPTSYDIDYIVACDLTEKKSNNRAIFRLVYDGRTADPTSPSGHREPLSWSSFKHYNFECNQRTAEQIVQKLNHILELRCSLRRKEYLSIREEKSHNRRSFHFGPR